MITEKYRHRWSCDQFDKPIDWPINERECVLENIRGNLIRLEEHPDCVTREALVSLMYTYDYKQIPALGRERISEYEVALINDLYVCSCEYQICTLKGFLYEIIQTVVQSHKASVMMAELIPSLWGEDISIEIDEYKKLHPVLHDFYVIISRLVYVKDLSFAECIIDYYRWAGEIAINDGIGRHVAGRFAMLMQDLSHIRGTKQDYMVQLSRDEFKSVFLHEVKLFNRYGMSPVKRPLKGILMLQLSNYILMSRNGYHNGYLYKYLDDNAAIKSFENGELWIGKTARLNDKRERKVIKELFEDPSWIEYDWVRNLNLRPICTYFVSSFSKNKFSAKMMSKYGPCIYGYKGDRMIDLIGPFEAMVGECRSVETGRIVKWAEKYVFSQVVAVDVVYDLVVAKSELKFLCSLIDAFNISAAEKKCFLEGIAQYWMLSFKDPKWEYEQERRYVIFYDRYAHHHESSVGEKYLKFKSTILQYPDFILGNNPVRDKLRKQIDSKRHILNVLKRPYVFCEDCFMRAFDMYDSDENVCPICGGRRILRVDQLKGE